jgi:two-component system NtrC family sensor kinase
MATYQTIQDWDDLIGEFLVKSRSMAAGIFDLSGQLLDANQAMCYFLNTDLIVKQAKNSFVNPEFTDFVKNTSSGLVFEGLLTVGDFEAISYSLEAKVFRRNDAILVFAEADVRQLFFENKQMSLLNQEVNNLQRQLIREKSNLQNALKELKETEQMLVHSEKMNAMGKLVAGVAHEINNPIAFVYSNVFSLEKYISELVQSYVELEELVKTRSDQEIVRMVNEIRKKYDLDFLIDDIADMTIQSKTGLERVKTIIEDLRKFSRLDEAEMKEIDLIDNISSTVGIAGLEFSKRNIRLKLETPEKLMIECFPGQLNQALLNVIVNAAQAIEADGNITISVREDLANVQIKIADDGCGIPENIRSKIFDPFFTSKPVGSGTGLGLSITYKIITELHQGSIEVDSAVGQGSTFILSIPKKQKY